MELPEGSQQDKHSHTHTHIRTHTHTLTLRLTLTLILTLALTLTHICTCTSDIWANSGYTADLCDIFISAMLYISVLQS
jgi:hypothetical protein